MEEYGEQEFENFKVPNDEPRRDGVDAQMPPKMVHVESIEEGNGAISNANGNDGLNKLSYCQVVAVLVVPILNVRYFELLAINAKGVKS